MVLKIAIILDNVKQLVLSSFAIKILSSAHTYLWVKKPNTELPMGRNARPQDVVSFDTDE